jgi:hypothetical protein
LKWEIIPANEKSVQRIAQMGVRWMASPDRAMTRVGELHSAVGFHADHRLGRLRMVESGYRKDLFFPQSAIRFPVFLFPVPSGSFHPADPFPLLPETPFRSEGAFPAQPEAPGGTEDPFPPQTESLFRSEDPFPLSGKRVFRATDGLKPANNSHSSHKTDFSTQNNQISPQRTRRTRRKNFSFEHLRALRALRGKTTAVKKPETRN